MYSDDLVLYGELEEDLKVMVGFFAEVYRRRVLKVNAGKSMGMVLGREEGLDESGTDESEYSRKVVVSGWRVAGTIRFLVNAWSLQLGCAKILHESLLKPVLTYGSETMIWREKERLRVRAIQMDNVRGLLGIRRKDKVPNTRIRQLCRVMKTVDEKIDGVLQWFGHVMGPEAPYRPLDLGYPKRISSRPIIGYTWKKLD